MVIKSTSSKGIFYKNNGLTPPVLKFDLFPQTDDTVRSDCRHLPVDDNSINCIMFDPPFIVGTGPSMEKVVSGQNMIHNRFSSFPNPTALYEFYKDSLKEFYRILTDNGILIFKCQDTVSSGTNYMSHIYIHNMAISLGFYPKDLFILTAKSRIISGKHKVQKHARKYHSYFWVFEKNNNRINKIDKYNFVI